MSQLSVRYMIFIVVRSGGFEQISGELLSYLKSDLFSQYQQQTYFA